VGAVVLSMSVLQVNVDCISFGGGVEVRYSGGD